MPQQPIFEYVPVLGDPSKAAVRILSIAGLSTKHDAVTSDRGRLYGSLTASGGVYTLSLFSDVSQASGTMVLTGSTSSLGAIFALSAANSSQMSGRAILDAYSADDTSIVVIPTFATDADVRRDIKVCAQLPSYNSAWGFAYFHADAMKALLTTWLPQEIPHLFGRTGLSAFVPTAMGATLPDLRNLVSAGQLSMAQADLTEALSCRQSIHIPAFATMYSEAMARFNASMGALKAANIQEQIEAVAEIATDQSGIGTFSFSRF